MPKSPIGELVDAALVRLQKPYTEDVTHDVFEAIETDQALRRVSVVRLNGPIGLVS